MCACVRERGGGIHCLIPGHPYLGYFGIDSEKKGGLVTRSTRTMNVKIGYFLMYRSQSYLYMHVQMHMYIVILVIINTLYFV